MNSIKEDPDDLPDLQPFGQIDQEFSALEKLLKELKTLKPRSKPSYYVGQRLAKDFMSPFTGRVVATPSSSRRY